MLRIDRRSPCLLISRMVYALYASIQNASCSARGSPAGSNAARRSRYAENAGDAAKAS
jgi:hypothetical protein